MSLYSASFSSDKPSRAWDQKKIYFACEGNIGFWILDENFALGLADHHIDHFGWTNLSSALSIMNYELQTCLWHEIKAQFQKLWFDFKYLKTKTNAFMDLKTKLKIHPSALVLSSFLVSDTSTRCLKMTQNLHSIWRQWWCWRRDNFTTLQVNDYNRGRRRNLFTRSPCYWSDLR